MKAVTAYQIAMLLLNAFYEAYRANQEDIELTEIGEDYREAVEQLRGIIRNAQG